MVDWSEFYKLRDDGPNSNTTVCSWKATELLDLEPGQPVIVRTTEDGTVEIKPINVEDH